VVEQSVLHRKDPGAGHERAVETSRPAKSRLRRWMTTPVLTKHGHARQIHVSHHTYAEKGRLAMRAATRGYFQRGQSVVWAEGPQLF
jgi:hypothetical protein